MIRFPLIIELNKKMWKLFSICFHASVYYLLIVHIHIYIFLNVLCVELSNLFFKTISQVYKTYFRLCCPPSLWSIPGLGFQLNNAITSDRQPATLLSGFLYADIHAQMGLKVGLKNLFWRLLCAIGFHKKPLGGSEGYWNCSRQPDTGLSLKWSQSSRSERKL